jgi:hypothetical protein
LVTGRYFDPKASGFPDRVPEGHIPWSELVENQEDRFFFTLVVFLRGYHLDFGKAEVAKETGWQKVGYGVVLPPSVAAFYYFAIAHNPPRRLEPPKGGWNCLQEDRSRPIPQEHLGFFGRESECTLKIAIKFFLFFFVYEHLLENSCECLLSLPVTLVTGRRGEVLSYRTFSVGGEIVLCGPVHNGEGRLHSLD